MLNSTRQKQRARIGILGGTFNPIHLGHLLIAQDALEAARLDRVLFIPAATPPHKPLDGETSSTDRQRMVKLAIAGDKRFVLDDREIRRGGKSYSVDTVTALHRRYPRADFFFIIGADSLSELHLWKDARQLVKLCRFIAVTRPGYHPKPARLPGLRFQLLDTHPCAIASREIRERVRQGQSIRYLVPDAVVRYIERQLLFQ
jgi:nicotinate-nucleotide adenylyltransferase